MRFTAQADFFSPETNSQYVKGLSYQARPGDKALALLPKWIEEEKIVLGGPASEISGKG